MLTPNCQLKLECYVGNPEKFDIYIHDAWVEVSCAGMNITSGRIFDTYNNAIDPAIISAGGKGLCAFHISLSSSILQKIEEKRSGGDILLSFNSRVLASKVIQLNDEKILAVPFETAFGMHNTGTFGHHIPQSEWVKLLRASGWSEIELIEIPFSKIKNMPQLARASARFKDAEECFRRGDWEGTMMNCRKIFESIVQDTIKENDLSKSSEAYEAIINNEKKSKSFNEIVKSLSSYLHLGRHENMPSIQIRRIDAELALRLSGALLTYLAQ